MSLRTVGAVALFLILGILSIGLRAQAFIAYATGPDELLIVDTDTGSIRDTVPIAGAPTSIAISRNGRHLFLGHNTSVISHYDLLTGAVRFTGGPSTGGVFPKVVLAPDDSKLYAIETDGPGSPNNRLRVFDPTTLQPLGSVPVGSVPIDVAITPDGTKAYVTNLFDNSVSVVDLATLSVTSILPVSAFRLAMTPDGRSVYVGGALSVTEIDTATDTIGATIDLTVGSQKSGGMQEITVTPDGDHVVVGVQYGSGPPLTYEVLFIDVASHSISRTPLVHDVGALATNPGGTELYVSSIVGGRFSTIDLTSRAVVSTLSIPGEIRAVRALPVIIVPGFLGSELRANQLNGSTRRVWVALGAESLLALDPFGTSRFSIFPGAIFRSGVTDSTVLPRDLPDKYGGLIQALVSSGAYEEGVSLFACPYDWRLSNTQNASVQLSICIDTALDHSSGTVDIVAHSMGGLLARRYVAFGRRDVRKLVTIATPHGGTPDSFNAVVSGDLNLSWRADAALNNSVLAAAVDTLPSSYELMPNSPFVTDTDTGQRLSLSETYSTRFLPQLTHVPAADALRATIALDPEVIHVDRVNIIGTGFSTITELSFSTKSDGTRDWKPINEAGDSRVPVTRAVLPFEADPSIKLRQFYIDGDRFGIGSANVKHDELPNDPSVGELVRRVLLDHPTEDASGNSLVTHVSRLAQPPRGGTLIASSKSPINLLVTDGMGNRTGMDSNGSFYEEIPGSNFVLFENNQALILADGEDYSFDITATGSGTFALVFSDADKNNVNQGGFRFDDVPVMVGDVASVILPAASSHAPLALDQGGDGTVDVVVTEQVVQAVVGDMDTDGDVDQYDVNVVVAARNTSAIQPSDPRDLDGDGAITGLDSRKVVLLCTRPNCATSAPSLQSSCGFGFELALVLPLLFWFRTMRVRRFPQGPLRRFRSQW